MGGFFGAISTENCKYDVFFGTDYHSHLGTKCGGLIFYDEKKGYQRQIHSITSTPFRTKFESDLEQMSGTSGIGCISDSDPQPLLVRSHLGLFAIATVGIINNAEELIEKIFAGTGHQFMAMSSGKVNSTELIAGLINQCDNIVDGIRYAMEVIDGSCTILLMMQNSLIVARDKVGRLPVEIGKKDTGYCACIESFAFQKLGYEMHYNLGPSEILKITSDGIEQLSKPGDKMKVCAFMWTYYGYPNSNYEGVNVEVMRCQNGEIMARNEAVAGGIPDVDYVAGVPDSGIAHAIGYASESGIPYARPFVKYTPTWPRSFMPPTQTKRNLIAKMKLIPIHELIDGKKLLLIDDSIVRGTQLGETTDFLYESGAKEVHIRVGCPPLLFGCKYLSFSRSSSEMELITRRVITKLEGKEPDRETLKEYVDPEGEKYQKMIEMICEQLHFTSLRYHRIDDLIEAIGLPEDKICTYCWDGRE